jgi:hypothetical protein
LWAGASPEGGDLNGKVNIWCLIFDHAMAKYDWPLHSISYLGPE